MNLTWLKMRLKKELNMRFGQWLPPDNLSKEQKHLIPHLPIDDPLPAASQLRKLTQKT
jgi:hypothetical protein